MLGTRSKVILSLLVGIPVLLGFLALTFRFLKPTPATPITEAPASALSVLHFNDGYDVRNTPRFLTKWLERLDGETLTLFSGDLISPSLVSNYLKGDQFIRFMELSAPTVAVPGNHEYDFGEEQFESFKGSTPTQWVVANMKSKEDPDQSLSGMPEHHVTTLNGVKVGVFGLVDTNWLRTNKLEVNKYEYEPFDVAAKRVSNELKAQGCEMVFVVSHMANASDEQLLTDENDVDVVFGGHDHIFYVRRLNNKVLLKSGTDFDNFSHSKLFFTASDPAGYFCNEGCADFKYLLDEDTNDDQVFFNFTLPRKEGFLNMVIEKVKITDDTPRHAALEEYIQEQVNPVISDFLNPMVRLDTRLDTRETIILNRETGVGNFFADLARAYYGTDLGMVNAGIFKAEKLFQPKTFLRKIDLHKIFPYKRDVFVVLALTGEEILAALRESLADFPKPSHKFLSFSGLHFELKGKKSGGDQLVAESVTLDGVPLDPQRIYSVATVSGLSHQTFGLSVLKSKEASNPVPERLEPGELFEKFSSLASAPENIQEYEAFKQQFPDVAFSRLAAAHVSPKEGGKKRLTFSKRQPANLAVGLEGLNPEALRRVRLYSLVYKLTNYDNQNLWAIRPQVEKRLKVHRKVAV